MRRRLLLGNRDISGPLAEFGKDRAGKAGGRSVDELGYVPLSQTGAELLFEIFVRGGAIVGHGAAAFDL
jgi:hypothetical protein